MLLKKTYNYVKVLAYAPASVKSIVFILRLRVDSLNTDKKFLVSIFYKFVTGLPIQSSPLQSITWDTVCHSLQNRVTFAAFFKANRGTSRSPRAYLRLTKINSVVQPKYGNSKQCRTSSVSTLSHLNLSRLMACLKQHSTNLPTYSHPKGLKLSQRVRT